MMVRSILLLFLI